ncbi:MAG: nucleotidyltransferase substrate binding protein [Kiloniellaceae bacterium]
MEGLKERLATARRALATLQELSGLAAPSVLERDAAVKRFEYSFDIVWKTARAYLLAVDGVDERTPKGVIRAARIANLLTDEQTEAALAMTNDRNLTVRTYNEALARQIFGRLGGHAAILEAWLAAMSARV